MCINSVVKVKTGQASLLNSYFREMDVFLNSVSTCKFIEALIAEANEVGLGENSPKIDNQVVKKCITGNILMFSQCKY